MGEVWRGNYIRLLFVLFIILFLFCIVLFLPGIYRYLVRKAEKWICRKIHTYIDIDNKSDKLIDRNINSQKYLFRSIVEKF